MSLSEIYGCNVTLREGIPKFRIKPGVCVRVFIYVYTYKLESSGSSRRVVWPTLMYSAGNGATLGTLLDFNRAFSYLILFFLLTRGWGNGCKKLCQRDIFK